jgi:hypothetical protein
MEWLSESLVASRRYIWVTPSHGFIYKVDEEQLTQQPPAGLMEVKLTIRLKKTRSFENSANLSKRKACRSGPAVKMAAKHGPSPKRLSRAKTPVPRQNAFPLSKEDCRLLSESLHFNLVCCIRVHTPLLALDVPYQRAFLYLDRGGPRKMADGPGVFALPAALPTWHPPGGISIASSQELATLGLANVQRMGSSEPTRACSGFSQHT